MRTDVSEENITSIFRVENQPSNKPARLGRFARIIFDPEEGSDNFLRNIGFIYRLHDAVSQKMALPGVCGNTLRGMQGYNLVINTE
jgi:hypothetical protein